MRKVRKVKNQLLMICLVAGFFVGIIYQNLLNKKMVVINELFLSSNLQRYLQVKVDAKDFFIYVIKERILLFAIILLLSCVKWKKVFTAICLSGIGFFFGILSVSSVLQLGMKGLLLVLGGVFPQGIFYGAQYGMLLNYWYEHPLREWNHVKTIFVIMMFVTGMLLETYVNPIIVRWLISLII